MQSNLRWHQKKVKNTNTINITGEGEKRRNIPSDYVWVHPSMQLAAMDDGGRGEKTASGAGLQTEKSPMKGGIFSRLGKEKQESSLKVQPEVKQKYSPRRQVSR